MSLKMRKSDFCKKIIPLLPIILFFAFSMPAQGQQLAETIIEFAAFFEVEGDLGQPGVWIKNPENYLVLESQKVFGTIKPNGDFYYNDTVMGGEVILKGHFNSDMTNLEYMTVLFHQPMIRKEFEKKSYSFKLVNVPLKKNASATGGMVSSIRLLGDEESVRREIQQYVRDVSGEWQFPNGKSARIKRWLPDSYFIDKRVFDPNVPLGPAGLAAGYKVPILKVEIRPVRSKSGKVKG